MSSETPRDGDLLVRIGAIVFLVGAVATLATVAPLFLGADPLPSAAYFVCMLMGVGFLIAAAGVLRSVAAQRRQARASLSAAISGAVSGTAGSPR
ncbi:hypothetical protein QZH56_13265 [Streptomyces olivoreticuli]|uniref:Integral membrane protein n=1 Tax=Streptomyces blastmyceticus TaxID=68180 RepID=A0ABP3G135_9ACTN|nr:hypothetical protein [Streptomyces olivoreticuli]WKK26466.1 hypothetical protein QZH56_13265 [Streptomyces olivoreticuli]